MSRRLVLLFAVSTLLATAAFAAAREMVAGGGPAAALLFVALAVPAAVGLLTLVRAAYLDGRAGRGRAAAARELGRRL